MIATRPSRTTAETRRRAELSRKEASAFAEVLKCPECGFMVGTAYSDCIGHLKIKCQKCKTISVLNFAYFHTERARRRSRHSGEDRRWKRRK